MENQTMENPAMENQVTFPRKKLVLLIVAIACIAVMLVGSTVAYFTAEETAYNVITTGNLAMTLHEETDNGEPWPDSGIGGVMPGMDITKVVYLENNGTVDFYARIALDKIITPAKGVEEELNFKNITLDINTDAWTEKDGYYYYNETVKPGQKTEPLFTAVSFSTELGNEYMDARVEIVVSAQSVQSKNNGESALEAQGWPEEK